MSPWGALMPQASPGQKNLGNATEVEVIPTAQASPSRTQAVGVASQLRTAAFKLLLMGCRSSGAAFIKWGQWSATREDIFPAVRAAWQGSGSSVCLVACFVVCLIAALLGACLIACWLPCSLPSRLLFALLLNCLGHCYLP